ncbi:hypothetical protein Q604_UNBC18527G0001, partial [human gut metagenome]
MVVQIVEVRLEDPGNSHGFPARTADCRDDLAHREHDSTKLHQLLAQPIHPQLHFLGVNRVVEELILDELHDVVQVLDDVEMTVDEDVENGMDDAHRAVRDQIGVG